MPVDRRRVPARSLTAREIALASSLFRDSIAYDKINIHRRRYIVGQPRHSALTPNGNIYVTGAAYADDYALCDVGLRAFFIHELVHVWQYQLRTLRPVAAAVAEFIRHGFNYARAYHYVLRAGTDLLDYRIEQQAKIVEDYYRWHSEDLAPIQYRERGFLYRQVLSNFLADPSYPRLRAARNRIF